MVEVILQLAHAVLLLEPQVISSKELRRQQEIGQGALPNSTA